MNINDNELIELIETLPQSAKRSAYEYLNNLSRDHTQLDEEGKSQLESNPSAMNDVEEQQQKNAPEFIFWDESRNEPEF